MVDAGQTSTTNIPPEPPDGTARVCSAPNNISWPSENAGQVSSESPTSQQQEHANPNSSNVHDAKSDENLHGDWIVVSKFKREKKSKSKNNKVICAVSNSGKNGKATVLERKSNDSSNKFASLGTQSTHDQEPTFTASENLAYSARIKTTPSTGPPKAWMRKKRPRREPVFFHPNFFNQTTSKTNTVLGAPATALEVVGESNAEAGEGIGVNEVDNKGRIAAHECLENRPEHVRLFPGNIKTHLNVTYVGSNRLRFVDEPKPPDPSLGVRGGSANTFNNQDA
ncbi:hypothetical protein SESBI_28996 [Sesbania bispinosa]|nr:hypothetical protein SESBI_28996 [Sesbania bispinosa]